MSEITNVGINIAEKSTVIWNVADMLRGPFKPHEYGLVILPMTVIKRFHDCLLPTHGNVLKKYEEIKHLEVIDGFLTKASGYQFYNKSQFTFDKLLADPENIESNFRDYLAGFSDNVQDVLAKFEFDNVIKRMVESNTLYLVIKEFNTAKGYLGSDKISAVDCGYIFEDLVRRFNESYGEEAGAHFTSRDIIYLMTDILLCDMDFNGESLTVYDMAMGTSQMLSCMEERIHVLDADTEVTCYGQEFNPSTFAIAKADMMIRGGDPNNMRFGDTLSDDQFKGYTFDRIISNPPFGIDWKREQKAVEQEAALGENGRFGAGLPKISDGQQLFVLNGLAKLAEDGKMAIVQNGSPLFSGDADSGPSNIRQYILENDWLETIIQLSTDQFMNTGISTYIWVLNKNKPECNAGKVQLIDASHCYEPRRKSIGTKRNDITDRCRALIVQAYGEFENKIYGSKDGIYCESKIFDSIEFGYSKIVVERPFRPTYSTEESRISYLLDRMRIPDFLDNCKDDVNDSNSDNPLAFHIYNVLKGTDQTAIYYDEKEFKKMLVAAFVGTGIGNDDYIINYLLKVLCKADPSAPPLTKKGKFVADPDLRDTENVPLSEDIDTYFKREVLPYAPDAWIDKNKTKIGYEIPMTRYFYEYKKPEESEDILKRIIGLENDISASLKNLFHEEK